MPSARTQNRKWFLSKIRDTAYWNSLVEQVICELANWRGGRGRILIKYIQLQSDIKVKNNGAVSVVYVGSSLTVHNPLFFVH